MKYRSIRRIVCVSFALLVFSTGAMARDARPAAQWSELLRLFDDAVAQDLVPGASIALVENGMIVARHHYGYSDRTTGKRVDADTVFHWASITKTLNAIAIVQLRDHRQLSLEDPVTRYVPELRRIHNPYGSMDEISLIHLLDHSAGFQGATWPYTQNRDWEPFEPTTWEQLVAMMPYQQIAFAPGSRYSYSNPSWIYLARALEGLTGDPWEAYTEKNIFAPLGMSRSYFRRTPHYLTNDRSHRYGIERRADGQYDTVDWGAEFDPGITVPNGGWNSPLDDVAAYIAFLTGADGGDERRRSRFDAVLNRTSLEEMWRPRLQAGEADRHIGFAFFIKGSGTRRVIGHTGGQGGFNSMMYFNPDTKRGVVAAFNSRGRPVAEGEVSHFRKIETAVYGLLQ